MTTETEKKIKNLCVFCGSSVGSKPEYREAAEEMGKLLASRNIGLVYGGGRIGLMGVLANTVLENNGKVTGVIPGFLSTKEIRHDGLTQCYEVDDMHTRKQMMYQLSDAFVAMPGGFGTLDELFEIITWHQLSLHQKPVVIYNAHGYFDPLLEMIHKMYAEGFVPAQYKSFLHEASTQEEVAEMLAL